MREDWKYSTIGEICDILDSKRKPITKNKRLSGSIPYYGATGVLDYVKDYIFNEKLVLLGEDGAKWGAGENSAYIIDGKSWVNNHAHALRPHRNIIVDEFLVCFLNYTDLSDSITGVTVPKLNQEKMRAISIPVPPLSEQERIVSLLDTQFAKIDALKGNATSQLQAAKDLFQAALKQLLTPKEGWEMKRVGDIFNSYSGGTPLKSHQEYYTNARIPWLNSGEVCRKYITETDNYINEEGLKNSSAKYFPKNTVLVAMYGATAAQAGILKFEATSNQAICGLLPNDNMMPEFVYYWFVYNKEIFASMAQGGAQPNLSQIKIKAMPMPYIEKDKQKIICEKLTNIEEKVKALQANYDQTITLCNDLKQALLKSIFA